MPPMTHRRMTIYGLGGCGKSALALQFMHRAIVKHSRRLVFWVPAISRESFELAYREIGILLRIPGILDDNADVKQLVKKELSSGSSGDWLMVVDNADDSSVLLGKVDTDPRSTRLSDFLPRSDRGTILFTTRSRKAAENLTQTSIIKLDDMDRAEARQLIAQRLSEKELLQDERAVDELLGLLAYLPLAIVQAAAFINSNEVSIAEYISLFRNPSTEIQLFSEHFEDPSRYREMESTIAKTWHISFDQILKQDHHAAAYLSFMACIDRVNIPQSLMPYGDSPLQRAKAIGTLKAYAFITERQQVPGQRQGEKLYDIHRLVHMTAVWWLKEHGEWMAWMHKVALRLEELVPYGGHEKKEVWTAYLSHAMHVAALDGGLDVTVRSSLLDRVGQCRASLGQYLVAERTHRQALSLREKNLGKEHDHTTRSMNEVGMALYGQGKYEAAEAMNRQTLAIREKLLEKGHPNILTSMNNLAMALGRQGKYEEAEVMHRQTLAMREKVLEKHHPSTLTSMNNMGEVLSRQGKYEQAEAMYTETLRAREKVLGKEHPDTLMSMNGLALALGRRGKYDAAENLHLKVLATMKTVLGKEHPETLMSTNHLAVMLGIQGRFEEAEAMHRQTLAAREKVLGKEHPNTLASMSNLALVLSRQGKHKAAENTHRTVHAARTEVLGEEHPDTLASMNNLAGALGRQHRYKEAETMHRQTLAARQRILGSNHPSTLASMSNLADMLLRCGKYQEAETKHRQTLIGREGALGREHPYTLASMSNLADVLSRRGNCKEAETMHRRTLAIREKVLGKEHHSTLTSMSSLVRVLNTQGKYEEAGALNRQMVGLRRNNQHSSSFTSTRDFSPGIGESRHR
jgi:tetratricopeptide (TPR) repeat protein